jgi:hypothetical protein
MLHILFGLLLVAFIYAGVAITGNSALITILAVGLTCVWLYFFSKPRGHNQNNDSSVDSNAATQDMPDRGAGGDSTHAHGGGGDGGGSHH